MSGHLDDMGKCGIVQVSTKSGPHLLATDVIRIKIGTRELEHQIEWYTYNRVVSSATFFFVTSTIHRRHSSLYMVIE